MKKGRAIEENTNTNTQKKAEAEKTLCSPAEKINKETLASTFGVELGPFLGLVCPVCRPQRLTKSLLSSSVRKRSEKPAPWRRRGCEQWRRESAAAPSLLLLLRLLGHRLWRLAQRFLSSPAPALRRQGELLP